MEAAGRPGGRARGVVAGIVALALYGALSALLLGRHVLGHPKDAYAGFGNDAEIFIWMLRWWPHAISSGHDPFAATAVWAPGGVNLAWVTSVPGAALVAWPITALAGPVAAYDVVLLAAPALSAWAAFVLCRHVGGDLIGSLAGGYVYGFSSYELGQSLGHLHAAFVPFAPLAALVLIRSAQGGLGGRGTVLRLAALLAAQFLFSTEVCLTLVLAAAAGLALAWWVWPERRDTVRETARRGLLGGALAALVVSPYLVEALWHLQTGAINSPFMFAADALNWVVPTRITLLGGHLLGGVSDRFRGNLAENGAYLGLPLLAIAVLLFRERRGDRTVRFVTLSLALSIVASLGPLLQVAGVRVAPLPWLPLAFLPVTQNILPVRLAAYASLAAGVALALFPAGRTHRAARLALAALAVAALLPDVGGPYFGEPVDLPAAFSQPALLQRAIPHGANVLLLPFGAAGHGMLWQAESGFWFRQAGGYVAPDPPGRLRHDPMVRAFLDAAPGAPGPEWGPALRRFLRQRHVDEVVLEQGYAPLFGPLLATLGVTPRAVGGVLVYRLR